MRRPCSAAVRQAGSNRPRHCRRIFPCRAFRWPAKAGRETLASCSPGARRSGTRWCERANGPLGSQDVSASTPSSCCRRRPTTQTRIVWIISPNAIRRGHRRVSSSGVSPHPVLQRHALRPRAGLGRRDLDTASSRMVSARSKRRTGDAVRGGMALSEHRSPALHHCLHPGHRATLSGRRGDAGQQRVLRHALRAHLPLRRLPEGFPPVLEQPLRRHILGRTHGQGEHSR